jgi:hypothetical protein
MSVDPLQIEHQQRSSDLVGSRDVFIRINHAANDLIEDQGSSMQNLDVVCQKLDVVRIDRRHMQFGMWFWTFLAMRERRLSINNPSRYPGMISRKTTSLNVARWRNQLSLW